MRAGDLSFTQSPVVGVVSVGQTAEQVAQLLGEAYPVRLTRIDDLAALASTNQASRPALSAVVLLASTQDSGDVVAALSTLRGIPSTIRPRIWPTFVAGDPALLADFDCALDEADSPMADVVLMVTKSPSAQHQADALAAWLRVKVPAPASVLACLPDSAGRTCRYVALGATEVAAPHALDEAGALDAVTSLIAVAQEELAERAPKLEPVENLASAAAGLADAAREAEPAKILRADRALATAVTLARGALPDELAEIARHSVGVGVAHLPTDDVRLALILDAVTTDSVSVQVAAPELQVELADAVSGLVIAASRGGLAKVLRRSKINDLANLVSEAATTLTTSVVNAAVAAAQLGVADIAASALREAVRQGALQQDEERLAKWNDVVAAGCATTNVWPTLWTEGVTRSWGGGVPAPRYYVVGSTEVVLALKEQTDVLTVIDLREPTTAVVLVAQYGLPLAALHP